MKLRRRKEERDSEKANTELSSLSLITSERRKEEGDGPSE